MVIKDIKKTYKNLKQLNQELAPSGFRINEKGEIIAQYEGKDYVIGRASFTKK